MDLLDQLIDFVSNGINFTIGFIQSVWNWVINQISSVPWNNLGSLVWWKQLLLLGVAGGVGYFFYMAGREIIDAGQKALSSFTSLLSVFVKTLIPIALAGLVAAAGAWAINSVQF
jgi:hypothetical protein